MFLLIEFSWVIVLVAMVFAMSAFDSKSYKFSAFIELAILGFVGWVINVQVEGGLMSLFNLDTALKIGAGYVAAGVAVAFVQYIVYCWRVKENYSNLVDDMPPSVLATAKAKLKAIYDAESLPDPDDVTVMWAAKHSVVNDNIIDLLEDEADGRWGTRDYLREQLKINSEIPVIADFEAALKKVLPPKFKMVKGMLLWSGIMWPVTLAWLLLFRFVRQIIERIMSWSRVVFDFFGSLAFGKL